jgi:hypothetical protein
MGFPKKDPTKEPCFRCKWRPRAVYASGPITYCLVCVKELRKKVNHGEIEKLPDLYGYRPKSDERKRA